MLTTAVIASSATTISRHTTVVSLLLGMLATQVMVRDGSVIVGRAFYQ